LSSDDRFILRQTHTVDAMGTLLAALKSYATNHDGQYPGNWGQLIESGALGNTNFAGNLGLDDFELAEAGAVDPNGRRILLRIRTPIPKSGGQSVIIEGAINDEGVPCTETFSVSPE